MLGSLELFAKQFPEADEVYSGLYVEILRTNQNGIFHGVNKDINLWQDRIVAAILTIFLATSL